jgi:dynein heavy chain
VTKGELYGESNPYTNEWQEGIVSSLVKSAVDDADNEKLCENKRWVNFDGPVDAMWIENMNTVLDDNKMLCLPNGERIKMPDTCTMMFEVNDLVEASPATVSRCGMVYLEPVYLGWEPLVHTWIEEMDGVIAKKFLPFIRTSLIQGIRELLPKIRRNCKEMITSQDCNIVQSCLNFIYIFLNMETIPLENKDRIFCPEKPIMNYLAFAMIWAFGGNLHDDSRNKFQKYFREALDTIECEYKAELPDGDLFEYTIDTEYYKFQHWDELKTDFKYDREASYFNVLVPTSDTVKYNFMI